MDDKMVNCGLVLILVCQFLSSFRENITLFLVNGSWPIRSLVRPSVHSSFSVYPYPSHSLSTLLHPPPRPSTRPSSVRTFVRPQVCPTVVWSICSFVRLSVLVPPVPLCDLCLSPHQFICASDRALAFRLSEANRRHHIASSRHYVDNPPARK